MNVEHKRNHLILAVLVAGLVLVLIGSVFNLLIIGIAGLAVVVVSSILDPINRIDE